MNLLQLAYYEYSICDKHDNIVLNLQLTNVFRLFRSGKYTDPIFNTKDFEHSVLLLSFFDLINGFCWVLLMEARCKYFCLLIEQV